MAYYDALITKWGTLSGTTASKLSQINALTAVGPAIPMIIPSYMIYNVLDTTEFTALTAANQTFVRDLIGMGMVDGSPGKPARARLIAIYPSGTTRTALNALAATYDSPTISWWKANGYERPFDLGDISAAGLS